MSSKCPRADVAAESSAARAPRRTIAGFLDTVRSSHRNASAGGVRSSRHPAAPHGSSASRSRSLVFSKARSLAQSSGQQQRWPQISQSAGGAEEKRGNGPPANTASAMIRRIHPPPPRIRGLVRGEKQWWATARWNRRALRGCLAVAGGEGGPIMMPRFSSEEYQFSMGKPVGAA